MYDRSFHRVGSMYEGYVTKRVVTHTEKQQRELSCDQKPVMEDISRVSYSNIKQHLTYTTVVCEVLGYNKENLVVQYVHLKKDQKNMHDRVQVIVTRHILRTFSLDCYHCSSVS